MVFLGFWGEVYESAGVKHTIYFEQPNQKSQLSSIKFIIFHEEFFSLVYTTTSSDG